jgi:hypothetical protein
VSVLPYPYPQLFKVFKHLIYVWHGCGMQFERFYSLNDSVVGSFPHLHHLWFHRTLPNLGKPLWWVRCECAAMSPSAEITASSGRVVVVRRAPYWGPRGARWNFLKNIKIVP